MSKHYKENCIFLVENEETIQCSCCKDLNCRNCSFYRDKNDKEKNKTTVTFLNWYKNRYYPNSHTLKD